MLNNKKKMIFQTFVKGRLTLKPFCYIKPMPIAYFLVYYLVKYGIYYYFSIVL